MNSDIIIALISGLSVAMPSLVATLFSYYQSSKKNEEIKNLTLYRLEELEKKVDKQNNTIEMVYKLKNEVEDIKDDMNEMKGMIYRE